MALLWRQTELLMYGFSKYHIIILVLGCQTIGHQLDISSQKSLDMEHAHTLIRQGGALEHIHVCLRIILGYHPGEGEGAHCWSCGRGERRHETH